MSQKIYLPLDLADYQFIKDCIISFRQAALTFEQPREMIRCDQFIKFMESHKNNPPSLVLYQKEVVGLARTLLDPGVVTVMRHWFTPSLFHEICEKGVGTPIMTHEFARSGDLPGRHLSDLQELVKQRWEQFYLNDRKERK